MENDINHSSSALGTIRIAPEVIAVIAGLAATEIDGVAGMSAGGIVEKLKGKNLSKGVKVEVGEKEAAVDLFIIVEFGAKIPDVAYKIQENVKKAIESMTGLAVVETNVHVQGVDFKPLPELKEEESRVK